jgi:hypothetical protein
MSLRETIATGCSRIVARCFSPRLEFSWPPECGLKLRATPKRRRPPNVIGPSSPKPRFARSENLRP